MTLPPEAIPYSRTYDYGVATMNRLSKIIGLFCRISSLLKGSFAKEIYNFQEPTNRSHVIRILIYIHILRIRMD